MKKKIGKKKVFYGKNDKHNHRWAPITIFVCCKCGKEKE